MSRMHTIVRMSLDSRREEREIDALLQSDLSNFEFDVEDLHHCPFCDELTDEQDRPCIVCEHLSPGDVFDDCPF